MKEKYNINVVMMTKREKCFEYDLYLYTKKATHGIAIKVLCWYVAYLQNMHMSREGALGYTCFSSYIYILSEQHSFSHVIQ